MQASESELAIARLESLVAALGGHLGPKPTRDSAGRDTPRELVPADDGLKTSGVMRRAARVNALADVVPNSVDPALIVEQSTASVRSSRDVGEWCQDPILRALLDALPMGVWLVDAHGKIVHGNTAGQRIWAGARYVGPDAFHEYKAWWSRTGEPLLPHDWAAARAISKGEISLDEELEIECFDGTRKSILHSAVPIFADDLAIRGAVVINQDVSERRHAEAERARLFSALDQAADIVYITNPDGVIEYANAAFESVTGYSRAEAIGQTPRLLNSGKQSKEFYQDLWNTILAGRPWRGRLVNRRKNGTEFVEDATIAPSLDARGRVVHLVAVSRDVTEQLHLAERVLMSQKMEAIGTLAGGVAHDFNNLLAVILGYTRFAVASLDPSDPLHQDLEEVLNAGERAAALTQQLLAFGRKQVLEPRIIDCNEVIERLASMLRRLIGENIAFKLCLSADLGTMMADPAQLEQVIMNLVVNARDAMPDGGTMVIETTNVDLDDEYAAYGATLNPGSYVRITVTDNGCGMSDETLAHLFEPFFTTKSKNKGTGLGLSTVYGIVKQSGGSVGVESALGQGTSFSLYFPRRGEVAQGRMLPRRDSRPSYGTETILVVEDEAAVRRSIVRKLEAAGYFVLSAANAEEALFVCTRQGPQVRLLLTDVIMPQVSGVQLAQQVRELYPHIRVVFMSGYPADALGSNAKLGSTIRFIHKPFAANELEATIREVLNEP